MTAYRLVRSAAPAAPPLALDEVQRAVTEHAAGPLLVLGAPGTGKTSTLVEAVAARVEAGAAPDSVLVLTFGRRGARRLRDRIGARLSRVGGEPVVRTFHGYAFGLLRLAAAAVGDPPPRLLTGPEQDLVIRELLADDDSGWPDGLRPALHTRAFAEELRDLLLRAAERGIGPAALARLGEAHRRPDWLAAARFYSRYTEVLALRDLTARAGTAFDYAELIRAAVSHLRADPELLAGHRRSLRHVYVDELHDTDPAQIELLSTVAGQGGHLVAFADPDSSTFGFRGADPSIVNRFPEEFRTVAGGAAPTLRLPMAYRGGTRLREAALRVSARLGGPSRHRFVATPPDTDPGTVDVRTFRSATSEATFVAHRLREYHLLNGVPWSRMAVLVRSTLLQLAPLQRALQQAGVPTVTRSDLLPLQAHPAVAPLLLLLRCALEPERLDEDAAVALLHSPLGGADPLAERRLRQGLRALALAAGDRRPSGVLVVEALRDPTELAAVERRWARPARSVGTLLALARTEAAKPESTVEDVLWAVWNASGLAGRWANLSEKGGPRGEAADRDLDAVVALFDTAARFVDRLPGARTEVFLDHVFGQELPSDAMAPVADRGDAVRILTAHAAKGLEWDVVAVAGVQEGLWPDLRLRGSVLGSELLVDLAAGRELGLVGRIAATLDEERRLFHVAATRARRALLMTAVSSGDGEEQPSRFLHELDPDAEVEAPTTALPRGMTLPGLVAELRTVLADSQAGEARKRDAARMLAELAAANVPGADPDDWWGLRELSDERPLVDEGEPVTVTPSTVDSVRRCSLRWLLERHGGGTRPSPEQGIGNLVHAAAMLAGDAGADRAALVSYVAERFDAIELSARWLAGRERDRAEGMLDKLVSWLAGNPRRLIAIEQDFLVQLTDPDGPVEIKGRVDRLELDEQGRLVVVDLKTGKSAPVNADVAEHPQLAAYQAAVAAGAFEESTEAGGASLVQLGTTNTTAREQVQPPPHETTDPNWAVNLVKGAARAMANSTFEAVANNKCRACPVRNACPVSGRGRQVTDL
ncbi:DNA helicase [Virgisporangium aliadipatigenens]|uniref:DNA 3'-5' helicase n=1 Tax=Virgisporangium aliadipatigenens TaxID=741659 RepID=A0A8J3YQU5_9ACTN|nr:ATP-dependent DNA helicase [Virgisporangium aliadipatigenens]GIJ50119.1 DNA helicase [Virgisporangium aliadipatigenens]